ncbi:MAG: hypothetical protein WA771_07430, partial [Chthoniobacterales bacterium]
KFGGGRGWAGDFPRKVGGARGPWWAFDFAKWRYSRKAQLAWIRRRTPLEATGPHSFAVGAYQRALAAGLVRKFVRKGGRVALLGGELSDLRPLKNSYELRIADCGSRNGEFDAVVSFDRDVGVTRENLEAMGRGGALQVHLWTAYRHPQHVEVARAGRELIGEADDLDRWVEAMMDDESFLFMSPRAIERFWPGSNAGEIGRPFSLNVVWRTGR